MQEPAELGTRAKTRDPRRFVRSVWKARIITPQRETTIRGYFVFYFHCSLFSLGLEEVVLGPPPSAYIGKRDKISNQERNTTRSVSVPRGALKSRRGPRVHRRSWNVSKEEVEE